jgi:tryptophan halogenase
MPIPESLREKIELFRTRGLTIFPGQTIFQEPNWLAIMMGQGQEPEGYDPLADLMDDRTLAGNIEHVRAVCRQVVDQMPLHAQVLERYANKTGPA